MLLIFRKIDDFVKRPISALCALSQNFTYAAYAAFFKMVQALILNVLQSRLISTLYECIKMNLHLFKMLDVKVYFGRCPNHVPKGAIVFFPCHMNRFSCGFTGIVAFSRQESPPAGIDLTPLTAELTKIRQNGFSACSDMSADDFTERI